MVLVIDLAMGGPFEYRMELKLGEAEGSCGSELRGSAMDPIL